MLATTNYDCHDEKAAKCGEKPHILSAAYIEFKAIVYRPLVQVLVSRITGQVAPSTHMSGFPC
jgi:hypothetical protein